jgi:hypothetical protein
MATNAPSLDVKAMLVASGVTTAIYVSKEPTFTGTPILTIYDTGGEAPSPKFILDFPSIQIRSKAKTYVVAYANLLQCVDLLNGRTPETKNTTRYTGILATTGIMQIGVDENENPILVVNFKLFTENASSTYRSSL